CVRRVHHGEQVLDQDMLKRALARGTKRTVAAAAAIASLTPRETEIVRLAAQGLRNRELAQRLSITEGTVKIHLHNIYEKLGVDGRLELVLSAQQRGLV